MNTRSFILSALIAGLVTGLLGNLPVINLVNCILCLWVWAGGILAVFLYRRFQAGEGGLTTAQGAGLGAVTGLVGAFLGTLVLIVTGSVTLPVMENLARSFQIQGDLPFKTGGFVQILAQAGIFLVIDVVLYPIFGAIGGLVATSLIWKAPKPQGV